MQFLIVQVVPSLLLFGILYAGFRAWQGDQPKPDQDAERRHIVLERHGKWTAMRKRSAFAWTDALAYEVLYFLALPWLVWRYGWRKGVLMVAVPLALLAVMLGAMLAGEQGESSPLLLVGLGTFAVLRAVLGLMAGLRSTDWRQEALEMRGWRTVGSCAAGSAKEAIRAFNPPPAKPK